MTERGALLQIDREGFNVTVVEVGGASQTKIRSHVLITCCSPINQAHVTLLSSGGLSVCCTDASRISEIEFKKKAIFKDNENKCSYKLLEHEIYWNYWPQSAPCRWMCGLCLGNVRGSLTCTATP